MEAFPQGKLLSLVTPACVKLTHKTSQYRYTTHINISRSEYKPISQLINRQVDYVKWKIWPTLTGLSGLDFRSGFRNTSTVEEAGKEDKRGEWSSTTQPRVENVILWL